MKRKTRKRMTWVKLEVERRKQKIKKLKECLETDIIINLDLVSDITYEQLMKILDNMDIQEDSQLHLELVNLLEQAGK